MKKLLSILMLLVTIVTGAKADPTYKDDFTDQQVLTLTSTDYGSSTSGYISEGWMTYAAPSTGSATLTIDPATDETIQGTSKTYGKVKNNDRTMHFYVTGISKMKVYFWSGKGRTLKAKVNNGEELTLGTTDSNTQGSFSAEIELDSDENNDVYLYATNDIYICALKVTVPAADLSGLEITPASGSYVGKVSVSMSANDGYTIYYTDNGDTPTSESTEYTGAFDVTSDKTIKAIAYKSGTPGAVKTANYTIVSVGGSTVYNLDAPTAADLAALRDAENTAWTDNGTDYISNAVNWAANTDNAIQDKDGNDISVANGLKFGRASNLSAGSFRYYYKSNDVEDYRIYFNNSSSYVKIPNVKKGQSVIITLAAGGNRTFTMTNATPASYSYEGENTKVTKAFVANADGTVSISNSGGGFSIYKIEVAVTEQVTIGKGGYSTYASDYNYVIVDGATAYTAQNKENSVAMTEIPAGTVIPAGKGVILKGEEDATASIKLTTDAAGTVTTDMVGVTEDNPFNPSDNNSVYVIATKAAGTKFYKYIGATFPEGKAYLNAAANAGDALDIVFDGATAVEAIAEANANSVAPVKVIKNGKLYIGNYNVAGQLVK